MISDLVFPESLRWRNGELWFVDMYDGKLFRSDATGKATLVYSDRTILGGIGWLPDGTLLVVDKPRRQILAIRNDKVSTYADLSASGTCPLNEMLVCENGDVFVGEYGFEASKGEGFKKGNVYHISPQASVSALPERFSFPNGMVESQSGDTLFLAETIGKRLSKFCRKEGSVGPSKLIAKFENGHPDGISIDKNGHIWLALIGTKSVACVNELGNTIHEIAFQKQPYDVCVADEPGRLFIALSDAQEGDQSKSPMPRTGEVVSVPFPSLY